MQTEGLGVLQAVVVDCANGVGGPKLRALAERLGAWLRLDVRNTGGELGFGDDLNEHRGAGGESGLRGGLNERCGAEHVQKERAVPLGCADVAAGARRARTLTLALVPLHNARCQGGALRQGAPARPAAPASRVLSAATRCMRPAAHRALVPQVPGFRVQGLGFGLACVLTGCAWPRCASLDGDVERLIY